MLYACGPRRVKPAATRRPLTVLLTTAYKQTPNRGRFMTDFALARRNMVEGQLRPNRVTNAQLLAVLADLPRERFLPEAVRSVAYADEDVPLGNGRHLIEPMVLARLVQALQLQPDARALVVASGCGYGAALLARLVASVIAVESDAMLARTGEQTAKQLGLGNITQIVGKPEDGSPAGAPYDAILIEGAVRQIPQAILDQRGDDQADNTRLPELPRCRHRQRGDRVYGDADPGSHAQPLGWPPGRDSKHRLGRPIARWPGC